MGSPIAGIHNLRPEQELEKRAEHPRDHDQFPSARTHCGPQKFHPSRRALRLPTPEEAESLAAPTQERVRLHRFSATNAARGRATRATNRIKSTINDNGRRQCTAARKLTGLDMDRPGSHVTRPALAARMKFLRTTGQFKMGKLGGRQATLPEIWRAALSA